MSKVMQALQNSEDSHQASMAGTQPVMHYQAKPSSPSKNLMPFLIVLGLPLCAAGLSGYQSYTTQKHAWLESNVAKHVTIEVPFEFEISTISQTNALQSTYREEEPLAYVERTAQIDGHDDYDSISEDTEVLPQQLEVEPESLGDEPLPRQTRSTNQNSELFEQLDLSELSPELALKVESALNTSQVEPEQKGQAINLSQQPDAWYDRLPAMNFQTHVYSSRVAKRWVKINGVEYGEGDWIGDVELVAIEQQSCIIRYQGELIKVPALYDWQG